MPPKLLRSFDALLTGRFRGSRALLYVLILLPVLFISLFSYRQIRGDVTNLIVSRRVTLAEYAASVLNERFNRLTDLAVSLASSERLSELVSAGAWDEAIQNLVHVPARFPHIARVFLSDQSGTLMASHPPSDSVRGMNFAHRDWYRGVVDDEQQRPAYVSPIYRRLAEPHNNVIGISARITGGNGGELKGVLVIQVRAETLLAWNRELNIGDLSAYLVDQQGGVASHPSVEPYGEIPNLSLVPATRKLLTGEHGFFVGRTPLGSEEQVAAYAPIGGYGWGVIIAEQRDSAFAPLYAQLTHFFAIHALVLAFAFMLAHLTVQLLTRSKLAEEQVRDLNAALEAKSKQALAESEARYRSVVEQQSELVVRWTPDASCTFVNGAFCRFLGKQREQLLGNDFLLSIDAQDRAALIGEIRRLSPEQPTLDREHRFLPRGGEARSISWTHNALFDGAGRLVEIQSVGRDVTEMRTLEAELRQSQKMEAIGLLAGGIAHDFNNLLVAMLGYSEIILRRMDPKHALYGFVENIWRAGQRAATLTSQLLAFSRKQMLELKLLSLNDEVVSSAMILKRLIGEKIEVALEIASEPIRVRADETQLQQVLMNLVINARDAMPNGGRLEIALGAVRLDRPLTYKRQELKPGDYAVLSVSDTGTGMTVETLEHIFEPFFTTKEKGKGTGLGLSTVYGVVMQHGGLITVDTTPGKGTTFKVYLPRLANASRSSASDRPKESSIGHGEIVLVVEDEDLVRDLVFEVLGANGYIVLLARDGREALSIAREQGGKIDLLLTDVVMPGMTGGELYDAIHEEYPDISVVFMSGYTHDLLKQDLTGKLGEVLSKPFSSADLLARVEAALRTEGVKIAAGA